MHPRKMFLMCCLLGRMVACLLVPCTSRERSRDMVHYNCLDSLTAGLKQTNDFGMIANIYQGVCIWGFWASSVSLPRSLSWLTRVLSTLPIPPWLGLLPVPVTGRSTSPYRRPLHTNQNSSFGALCDGRGLERVAIHAAECTAPHSPSQMSPLPRLPL
jgi:hypothetical protein